MADTKRALDELAGNAKGPMTQAPTIMEPSGDVPGSLTIEPPDGADMRKPNSAHRWAAPVEELVKRARGGK